MADPLLSVLIPARDAATFIGEAIASALEESHRPIEILVVDDGSADATAAIADGFGPPVRVLRQPPLGTPASRNRLVECAAGKLLLMLDADDRVAPGGIDKRVRVLSDHPGVEVVFGHERRFHAVDADGRPVANGELRPAPMPGSMLIRAGALARVGPFSTSHQRSYGLDWMLRAHETGLREVTLPDHVVWRRVHGGNYSLTHRDSLPEFTQVIRESLARRRATS